MRPNSCQQHKRRRLVKPSKQTQETDSVSAQLSSPPPLPPLFRLLLFHYLNMTGAPCSLSKAGDRWNWWALRVQHEKSGQALVVVRVAVRLARCWPACCWSSWHPSPFVLNNVLERISKCRIWWWRCAFPVVEFGCEESKANRLFVFPLNKTQCSLVNQIRGDGSGEYFWPCLKGRLKPVPSFVRS